MAKEKPMTALELKGFIEDEISRLEKEHSDNPRVQYAIDGELNAYNTVLHCILQPDYTRKFVFKSDYIQHESSKPKLSEPDDPKYQKAVENHNDTRCIIVDLVDTDENLDMLTKALNEIEGDSSYLTWCSGYDGYLDNGDEDRIEIVISNPRSDLFRMHINSLLRLLTEKTGKEIKLYQSKENTWYNEREFYDSYGDIDDMK